MIAHTRRKKGSCLTKLLADAADMNMSLSRVIDLLVLNVERARLLSATIVSKQTITSIILFVGYTK